MNDPLGRMVVVWRRTDPYAILVDNPEGKRPLGRSRHKWEDNIEIDFN
jgi:hypothetical protein